jgi:molybdopterin-guanine dinucleotide biosynthesis protein A
MGRDKATLPFGRHTVLEHVVETLMEAIAPTSIVVVSAAGQRLPVLPTAILVTHDAKPARGPLEGMAAGLHALPSYLDTAFVCSCDAPFVNPNVIQHLLRQLSNYDAAVPVEESDAHGSVINDRGTHPLCAVYHRRVLTVIEKQLASNELRVRSMVKQLSAIYLSSRKLREFDPKLRCLQNMNTPHDYEVALEELRATSLESGQ